MPNRAAMWHQDESGRVHTPFEPIVLAATLSLIPILIIEADAKSDAWQYRSAAGCSDARMKKSQSKLSGSNPQSPSSRREPRLS